MNKQPLSSQAPNHKSTTVHAWKTALLRRSRRCSAERAARAYSTLVLVAFAATISACVGEALTQVSADSTSGGTAGSTGDMSHGSAGNQNQGGAAGSQSQGGDDNQGASGGTGGTGTLGGTGGADTMSTTTTGEPAPTCEDGVKNGAESDVDCGGECQPCAEGDGCASAADCASALCEAGQCAACQIMDDCLQGQNCTAGQCTVAFSSCAEEKAAHASPDGEYWVIGAGGPVRVFCDMALEKVICSEVEGSYSGETRDASHLEIEMTAVLDHAAGTCDVWALRDKDGYPLDGLSALKGNTITGCKAFGFIGTKATNSCKFGAQHGNCGFVGPGYYRWGNHCVGCSAAPGEWAHYMLQGPMDNATVLSNMSGTKRVTCTIR